MVIPFNQLRLEHAEIFSTAEDSSGNAQEAKFWLTVSCAGRSAVREVYGLHVMTDEYYRKWYWEALVEEELGEADFDMGTGGESTEGDEPIGVSPLVFPLVVPAEQVGAHGLLAYMARTFLDVDRPAVINSLHQYLDGPVDGPNHRKAS